jgi:NADH:ubiquinone oxidoreductase subunit 3 (subunit A)
LPIGGKTFITFDIQIHIVYVLHCDNNQIHASTSMTMSALGIVIYIYITISIRISRININIL